MSANVQVQPSFLVKEVIPLPIKGIYQVEARSYDVTPDGKQFVVMFPTQVDPSRPQAEQINMTLNWFEELKAKVPTKSR